ncbi:acetyl/propionyl/methylcrotonyl-CoA carboxylase subunit alpha [Actinocorallia sp. A-T 12471]|uniref:acetyl/propionyl/methylcrotonyl-CoA carboxylase subunit alpha n=1 Tax=Actinocorallia sp. A-T 12471 TaxID=3089813 RepID=UPI0029CEAD1A|nr:biotin carboxylase N-terminal domain-containing protein [Actinocorallia sp. A-T 12471]MDX6740019.1 biotin carboxylase N-terminal domain-containing protein [Actinocorallia sp. A-T 12471]
MFSTVLIANRGEIAVRILRTLRGLGVRGVAVHAPDDAAAPHVRLADAAVEIPSYLDGRAVIAAALATGAEAVHPGYGFLSENAAFARECAAAGLVFVGPPPEAIDAMGDKISAKETVAAAGVPVVPGRSGRGMSDAEVEAAALEVGLPVLLKPSAGGGGKGMRLVTDKGELAEAIASARREAGGAFGDDTLLVERFVAAPRHIEVQVFADAHGNVVHLGERECSLQRRHQKIIEEAPSPFLTPEGRAFLGNAAVEAARAIGYVGAGTVEFIMPGGAAGEGGYFMEMNTRLQVEHPVTELVTGLDLVELQLRVAAGEPLPFGQDAVALDGHAFEARVYAEDPARGFLPTGGKVLFLAEPSSARVDSGIVAGGEVGSRYDPMLAKVIVHGKDRAEALRALDSALASYTLLGVPTNVGFLRDLLARPEVRTGELDTGLVERVLPELTARETPAWVPAAAALARMRAVAPPGDGPWDAMDGWRIGAPAWSPHALVVDGSEHVEVRTRAAEVAVGAGDAWPAVLEDDALVLAGRRIPHRRVTGPDGTVWIGAEGRAWAVRERERTLRAGAAAAAGGVLRSPMPGTVLAVKVAEGDAVAEGQPVVVVEAMKMEHTVTAAVAGTVTSVPVRAGVQVALDEVLAEITPGEAG